MAGSGRIYLFVGLVVMTSTNAMGELPWSPDPGRIWDFAVESPPWGDSIQLDPLGGNFDQHEETFPWESISSQEVHTHQPVDSLTDLQRSKIPQEPMVPSTVNHHVSSLSLFQVKQPTRIPGLLSPTLNLKIFHKRIRNH
ncbi:hypothetical protein KEM48_007332 [Puccinia striiformis f. sp. tritici PST-130]|nr:hypothetical protein KEM48_007332 [Puccinia striiformis f. sp. tritici PST-130]